MQGLPPDTHFLEYTVVHEMTHYFERNHGERFTKLMDSHLPDWPSRRELLNGRHWHTSSG